MSKNELDNAYFEWLYQLVCDDSYSTYASHRKLLMQLHSIEFTWSIDMDRNRACDGEDLRIRFEREYACEPGIMRLYFGDRPCSVLEMMIALSIRCEETIMFDPNCGNRTGQWFWSMIVSLGLGGVTDLRFDKEYVNKVIFRFLAREYDRDGKGGLFTIPNCDVDLRDVEIWWQMCWYVDSIT